MVTEQQCTSTHFQRKIYKANEDMYRMNKLDKICDYLGCKRSELIEVNTGRKTEPITSEQAQLIQLAMNADSDNVHLILEVLRRMEGLK